MVEGIKTAAANVVGDFNADAAAALAAVTEARPIDPRVILQPAIDAMSAHIAVLEPNGTILTVNERWRRFADENGFAAPDYGVGRNYFDGWCDNEASGGPEPRVLREGIRAVLTGTHEEYRALYPCHGNGVKRWFHLRVTPFLHERVRHAVVAHANVTPLIEASEALRESEARFRNIADTVPIFIYMLRPDGLVEFINKPLRDYHGLSLEKIASDVMEPIHPDDAEPAAIAFATAFQDPKPVAVEHRMRRADGEYRWFINQAIPRYDAAGRYAGYIGCCIDVHERKLAEHALAESERRFRTIFESAAVPMWESDFTAAQAAIDEVRASGVEDIRAYIQSHPEFVARCAALVTVRNVNDAAVRLAKANNRAHLMEHFVELFLPETFAEFGDELADLAEERGVWQRETVMRTLWGETRRCIFTISLPPAAPVQSVLAAVIDVTEQRVLQDALRQSEALNRAVLGSLKELIAVLDANGRIIAVNEAWNAVARCKERGARHAEAAVGVGVNYLEVLARAAAEGSSHAGDAQSGIQAVLAGEVEHFESEYRCGVHAADRWFLMTVVPLRGGHEGGAVVVHTDITDRKQAQNLMQALNARLLRAQEDERRRLAREMHDDVTQRLAVLAIEAGRLEMLLKPSCQGCDGAAPTAAVDKLRHMTEQIVKLSSDVHAISRQLHPSILDDLGLAEAIESECQSFTDREGIAVKLEVAALPDALPNDLALCFYRILQEALRNVAKHAATDRVSVSLSVDGSSLLLRVADEGVGFDLSRSRAAPGLGLASMRERARLCGAELHATSVLQRGTTIEVRAPLSKERVS
jgi:PAS domain S-box-containing protein